ncbi:MAG: ABC transporter permease, partial [Actinomycetes bacterium]
MSTLTGTGALLRLALRRDRILLPVWILVFAGTAASSASATVGLYPTVESRIVAARAANAMPALVAFYGPIDDPTSLGALSMLKLTVMGAALVALLMIIVTIRHTRAEEEAGRLELVQAGVVGRYAALTAALLLAAGASVVLGLLTAGGLIAVGLPAGGSLAFGLSWAMVGITFAAVAGVAAQLARSAKAAIGLSIAVLGVAYIMRAVADASTSHAVSWLSWCSPLGLGEQVQAYAGDRWWVLAIMLFIAVDLVVLSFVLASHRDLGTGMLADRAGPAHAGRTLAGPIGLAWNLQRTVFLAWLAGFVLLSAVLGNIASSAGSMMDSEQARELFARLGGTTVLTDAFLATEMGFVGFMAAAYGVQASMRLRSEETALHAETLLATGLGRIRWALSHILIAIAGMTGLLLVAGIVTAAANAAATGSWGSAGSVVAGALVQLPAACILAAVVVLLFGFIPRWTFGGWIVLVVVLLLAELGPLLQLSQTIMDISPFAHVPKLPGGQFTLAPLVVLLVVAAVLTIAGLF